MKKTICLLTLILATSSPSLWAIPSEINYQGTLREKGLPANWPAGSKTIKFQLTSQDGVTPYSNEISVAPEIDNGLFAAKLDFQILNGLSWETITPYIKVTVNGQVLTPLEKVSATVYANVSNSVVDGAITPAKVTAGYGLVPSGGIIMFAGNCPSGWIRFTALDNNFPLGGATYGVTGGQPTHSHVINPDGGHTHTTPALALGGADFGTNPTVYQTAPSPGWAPHYPGQTTSSVPNHDHGGKTQEASSMPPYLEMVFCQKL